MPSWLLELPLEVRGTLLFLLGVVVGGQLNRAIYRLAWNQRAISPWSAPPLDASPRHWYERLPVVGWFFLRREVPWHGRGFWIRPLLIELFTGALFALLYLWETEGHLLSPGSIASAEALHAQYLRHLVLMCLMIVATFIDFDEKTIPDGITLPGTLIALALAALLPISNLPVMGAGAAIQSAYLVVTSPSVHYGWGPGLGGSLSWPTWIDGTWGLVTGLACYLGWCYAILPRTWTTRRGLIRAVRYLIASILRSGLSYVVFAMAVLGSGGVALVWYLGGEPWQSFYSSLVGLAFGGGLIWAVRIIGTAALGKEAMGFGDVTLMSMIGAFLGWQPALIVFFLAPFAALVISVVQLILTSRKDIAFGPYLCLAAFTLIVLWRPIWHGRSEEIFALGWFIPVIVGVCLILMAAMLSVWRLSELWAGVETEAAGRLDDGEIASPEETVTLPDAAEQQETVAEEAITDEPRRLDADEGPSPKLPRPDDDTREI